MRQHLGEQLFRNLTSRRPSAFPVKRLLPMAQRSHHPIYHHISGTCIEGHYLLQVRVRRQKGQVSDSADVLSNAWPRFVSEQYPVGIRDKRRTLPTNRHVANAKISYRSDPRSLGN